MKGEVLGGGCEELSIVPVLYTCGKVSVLSLGYFFYLLVILLNLLILIFLFISKHATFNITSRKRGRLNKD